MVARIRCIPVLIAVILLIPLLFHVQPTFAGSATLTWDPPTTNADGTPLTDLSGYKLYYGTASRSYAQNVSVGNVTSYTLNNLTDGVTYYFAVTAYDTANNESSYSNEVSKAMAPVTPTQYTLSVTKSGTGSGTVTATGINCGTDCSEPYNSGTTVTLTAAASSNSTFTGWSGGCTGTASTCSVSMTAAKTVTATFTVNTANLTVVKSGTGSGTVTGTGISCGSDCSETVTQGTVVSLTASAATGSTFTGWSGGCTGTASTCSVSMTAAKTVTATFAVNTANLTVVKDGTGSGTVTGTGISCGADCSETVTQGTVVSLTASAATGSTFTGWSGGCTGTASTCSVSMTAAKTVTATFAVNTANLTVVKDGTGSGTVTGTGISCGSDCSETVTQGTVVSLTASAATGSTFTGWSGGCTGTASTCSVSMTAAKTVTASFAVKTYTITSSTGGHGTISPSGAVQVNHGSSQTFTIAPDPYYGIASVMVDGQAAGKVTSYTFSNVTAAHDINATFAPVDTDLDGVADLIEMGPSFNDPMYDASGDGIPDRQQANVASFMTFDAAGYLSLVAPEGLLLTGIASTQVPQGVPGGVNFPYQFVEFLVQNVTAGSGATLALVLPDGSTVNNYLKFGPTPDNPTPHWYEFMYDGQTGAEIQGDIVYLHFVDGLRGDDDLAANGQILDQGGPARMSSIAATPQTYDFGSVPVGSTSQNQTFTITNSGYNNLVLGTVSIGGVNSGDFAKRSDACSSATLAPSSSCSVTIAFAPLAEGSRNASLTIPSNDYDTPVLSIVMSGTATVGQFTLTVNKSGNGTVSSSPAGISCGTTCAGTFSAGTTVTLTAAPASDSQFMGWAGACSGTGGCVVTPNANTTVSAMFAIKSSSNITVSPTSIYFGRVRVGSTGSKTLSIRNTGSSNLVVSKVEISGTHASMFSTRYSSQVTVTPGGYFSLRARFSPTSSGSKSAVMRIYSNDPDTPFIDVPLSGTGR